MTKTEWLNILRETLMTELPKNEIDQNLAYYRDYMDREGAQRSEEDVLRELGEPRLIAKTIIDTYKMQCGGDGYNAYEESASYDYSNIFEQFGRQDTVDEDGHVERRMHGFHVTKIRWYHKAIFFAVLALLIMLVVIIGGVLLRVFFTIGLPVILVLMIIELIKRR